MQLKTLVWQKRKSGISGEIDQMIDPLREKLKSASAVISDPVTKTILLFYYSGIRPREMPVRYSDRHIYRLVKQAEEMIIEQ